MAVVSAKANDGLWQLAQLNVLSLDKMGSKNNFSPSFSEVLGIGSGIVRLINIRIGMINNNTLNV